MREREAQIVLLVRSFEETDPEGEVLSLRARINATRRAAMVTGLTGDIDRRIHVVEIRNEEAVARRARLLFDELVRRHPALQRLLYVAQLGASTTPILIGVALILGLLTNVLGPMHRINLLAVPLLGIVAWNLAAYGLFAFTLAGGRRLGLDRVTRVLAGGFLRGALWRRLHVARLTRRDSGRPGRLIARVVVRFGALWHRLAGALLAARVRRMLHLGAMALVIGAIAGMYLRGIALEYRATWQSTWLDAGQMQSLLDFVLAPASTVLGLDVPDVAALQGPGRSGPAAVWIHLYAMTALLFVIVPRGMLALLEGWRCARLARNIQVGLNDGYFRRLFYAWRGARVELIPYSFRLDPAPMQRLKTLLHDFFGARARIRARDSLSYGDDVGTGFPELEPEAKGAKAGKTESTLEASISSATHLGDTCYVLLFNLAQSPEAEVHGEFLEELKSRLEQSPHHLLVLLDAGDYRERVASPDRLVERRAAWDRVIREIGLTVVPVDLGAPASDGGTPDELMTTLRESLWPAESMRG